MRKRAMIVFAAALLLAAGIAAAVRVDVARAGVTCSTNAASEIAAATVTGPRTAWNPPVWSFFMPDLNLSIDVQANDQATAASKAQTALQGMVDASCPQTTTTTTTTTAAAPAQGSPSGGTTTATYSPSAQAQSLAASATVTDRGSAWSAPGQPDLWTVACPSISFSVDLYAATETDARNAALEPIDVQLGNWSYANDTTANTTAAGTSTTGGTTTGTTPASSARTSSGASTLPLVKTGAVAV